MSVLLAGRGHDATAVRGAYRRADGWHVRIDMRETAMPVELLTTVNNTRGIADTRLRRASRNVVGSWREVL